MGRCCRCNKHGTCNNCTCAKDDKTCDDCLPGDLGKCNNGYTATNSADSTELRSEEVMTDCDKVAVASSPLNSPSQSRESPATNEQQLVLESENLTLPHYNSIMSSCRYKRGSFTYSR